MVGACNKQGEDEKCMQRFSLNTWREEVAWKGDRVAEPRVHLPAVSSYGYLWGCRISDEDITWEKLL
jgi:hypothetical protein